MAIDITCNGCQQMLRVADEHAGKKARCPKCGTINSVPGPGDASLGAAPLGGEFGGWNSQPSQPSDFGQAAYSPPPQMPAKPSPFDAQNPFSDAAAPNPNPYASPQAPNVFPGTRYAQPHRGGTILTLGILGILCCGFLGIAAWAMGATDLAAIKAGRMDPSGHSMTMVGMILGIVATAFLVLGVLAQMAMLAVGA